LRRLEIMFNFFKIKSSEYNELLQKISSLRNDLEKSAAIISRLDLECATLRSNMNRKGWKKLEEQQEEKPKDLYSSVLLPER